MDYSNEGSKVKEVVLLAGTRAEAVKIAPVALALAEHPDGTQPVLVGDRAQDVVGARVHGLPCIGAGWGPARPGELAQAGAAVVVDTPEQVLGALDVVRL